MSERKDGKLTKTDLEFLADAERLSWKLHRSEPKGEKNTHWNPPFICQALELRRQIKALTPASG